MGYWVRGQKPLAQFFEVCIKYLPAWHIKNIDNHIDDMMS